MDLIELRPTYDPQDSAYFHPACRDEFNDIRKFPQCYCCKHRRRINSPPAIKLKDIIDPPRTYVHKACFSSIQVESNYRGRQKLPRVAFTGWLFLIGAPREAILSNLKFIQDVI